jgi:hypothetical protein
MLVGDALVTIESSCPRPPSASPGGKSAGPRQLESATILTRSIGRTGCRTSTAATLSSLLGRLFFPGASAHHPSGGRLRRIANEVRDNGHSVAATNVWCVGPATFSTAQTNSDAHDAGAHDTRVIGNLPCTRYPFRASHVCARQTGHRQRSKSAGMKWSPSQPSKTHPLA